MFKNYSHLVTEAVKTGWCFSGTLRIIKSPKHRDGERRCRWRELSVNRGENMSIDSVQNLDSTLIC